MVAAALATLPGGAHDRTNISDDAEAARNSERALPLALAKAPTPPPNLVPELAAEEAQEANAALPYSEEHLEIARPLVLSASEAPTPNGDSSLECLTAAIYYEAASESRQGQRAVAQVVLNRVRHPSFPNSVCGVVYQGAERKTGCQFTFTCDGSLRRRPAASYWKRAKDVAADALKGYVEPSVGMATHYHTDWVFPYWAPSLKKITKVGTHIFYGWRGAWGRRSAFNQAAVVSPLAQKQNDSLPTGFELELSALPTEAFGIIEQPRLDADRAVPALNPGGVLAAPPPSRPVADARRGTLFVDEAKRDRFSPREE